MSCGKKTFIFMMILINAYILYIALYFILIEHSEVKLRPF